CGLPGKVHSAFYEQARSNGIPYAATTLPMAGYVAADKNGPVTEAETAPSARWKPVVFKKNGPFTTSPDPSDNAVYADELVNYLKTTHGSAAAGGIKGYFLDNEPALWPSTHARIHPGKPTAAELWTKSRDLAKAVKDVDAGAEIYGGVFYGFAEFLNFQDAPDWNREKGPYSWFVDYFLAKMKAASDADGRRLMDALDVHWYPEARGDNRIVFEAANTANDRAARLQAPRSLWDPAYVENSWIATYFRDRLPLIPELNESIGTHYPGTKLSFSEYNYGGCEEITGGIAQADVLGIFGKYGVYNANFWDACSGADKSFVSAAFRMYTNYDGNGGTFGDTRVSAAMSDKVNASIYAAIDGSDEGRLHLVVINKSGQAVNGTFNVTSGANYTVGQVWGFDQTGAAITARPGISAISGNAFSYQLSPLSVHHVVLTASLAGPTTTVTVRARSINPGANLRIEVVDGTAVTGGTVQWSQTFSNLATSFTDYTATIPGTVPANRVRVRFPNDGGNPNRDLEVDYLRVAGTAYQTEAPDTWSIGHWNGAKGCNNSGYLRAQILHCNGYFHYDAGVSSLPAVTVYGDALAPDWSDWSWSTTNNFNNASPVKSGSKSWSAVYTAGWGAVSLRKATPQTTSGYSALRFWVHGGSGGNKDLLFYTQSSDGGGESPSVPFTATAGAWNEITVNLSALGGPAAIARINFQNNAASPQSTVYFDDLRLVAGGGTRVAVAGGQPNEPGFSLSPNPLRENILSLRLDGLPLPTPAVVRITDLLGRVVYQGELTGPEIRLRRPLARGWYVIQVRVGNATFAEKLLVEP
ncbi:MAG: T9SS type A sorting domain-containing protein, partial [Ferruginibacter sp.]|nr:T9SS type A sorting domain-containing protein [Cytophagales bacterium]